MTLDRKISLWLDAFAKAVRDRDYDAGCDLFSLDPTCFGTRVCVVKSRYDLIREQWRPVWEATAGFQFVEYATEGDDIERDDGEVERSPIVVVMAQWSSVDVATGVLREGRATIVLRDFDDSWLAVHSHFSLKP